MAKVWREIANPERHSDFMSSYVEGGVPIEPARDNLLEKWVYLAEVDGFVFQFANLDQVRDCKAYFLKTVHPSTREAHPPYEHSWHPWYCKLPKGMTKKERRRKVIKALDMILKKWNDSGDGDE